MNKMKEKKKNCPVPLGVRTTDTQVQKPKKIHNNKKKTYLDLIQMSNVELNWK